MTPDELRSLPSPLAFVFPGGGALGAYQVGSLLALAERDVVPDLLVGVSAGALNAALLAWNPGRDGVERVAGLWRSIRRRDLLRLHPGRLALAAAGLKPSFLDNRHGGTFLRQQFGGRRIEQAPTPLTLVATDLSTGEAVALTEGEAVAALLASTAFPGVYPPIRIGDRWLIDGGVVADMPLDITAQLGAATALIVDVPPLAPSAPPRRAINIVLRASTLGVEAHGRSALRRPPPGLRVVAIPAEASPLTTFSVGSASTVIDAAHRATSAWLNRPESLPAR